MEDRFRSYEEFWPFYVSQHRNATCRALHLAGTTLVFVIVAVALLQALLVLLVAPLAGYGFAWVGHFVFEKNKPATFTYPLWSLRGDFRMHRLMLVGRMGPEIRRAAELFPTPA
jgi:hypothetical protein